MIKYPGAEMAMLITDVITLSYQTNGDSTSNVRANKITLYDACVCVWVGGSSKIGNFGDDDRC